MLYIWLLDVSHPFMSRFSTEFMKSLYNHLKYGIDSLAHRLFSPAQDFTDPDGTPNFDIINVN